MAAFTFVLIALAALTCLACTLLLYRGFLRTGTRLLFWSALCFVGLSISNVLLFFDLILFPTEIDLRMYRVLTALVGLSFLLYGFISESE
jgi:drug/metabolite transporter (DMT)-like permease